MGHESDAFLLDRVDIAKLRLGPFISGIEVTQGIQYYRADQHLTDTNDRGPDNSVRLAANKPAWARVYLGSNFIRAIETLTGQLVVERRTGALLTDWTTVATLTPQPPGSARAQSTSSYVTERSTLGATLNFILGANLMSGMVRLTARVWRAGDATNTLVDTYQETVDVTSPTTAPTPPPLLRRPTSFWLRPPWRIFRPRRPGR
jgi:hypothetical protein